MNIYLRRTAATVAVLSILVGAVPSQAQDLIPAPQSPDQASEAPAPIAAPQTPVSQAPTYSQAQIDQLLAPVALYPDELVGQVLMASTYPLEVVEAARWLQDPNNAALKGDDLANALQQQTWDPSVKSLVATPQVLNMMNGNLQWTEQLGDAFLAQQTQVTTEVQHLRQEAQAKGNLQSTPQQTVETQGSSIVIQPAQPQVVYVPVYNPSLVYGTWAYPDYPPYYFPNYYYPGTAFVGGALIGFGLGIVVADSLWGWWHWDWHNHSIFIDRDRYAELNRGHAPIGGTTWQHDPAHRRGVPYRNAATSARFLGANANSPAARRTFRGFPEAANHTASFNAARTSGTHASTAHNATFSSTRTNAARTNMVRASSFNTRTVASPMATHTTSMQRSVTTQRQAAPMYESFARGQDVEAQSARGAASRASEQSFRTQAFRAPAASRSFAPRSGGGGGGGSRGGGGSNFRQR